MDRDIKLPDNARDFEALCCAIAKEKFADYAAQQYGISGQKQWGIDIKATNRKGKEEKIVIQCKYKKDSPKFTGKKDVQRSAIKKEMEAELKQALASPHFDFDVFVYAATIANDVPIQNFAVELSKKYQKEVNVWSLDTIEQDIRHHPRLMRLYSESSYEVEVIDQDFVDTLDERISLRDYTPSVFKFYTGVTHQKEQWYGIRNNWDAPRRSTDAIEKQIDLLFSKPYLNAKVAALIHGEGGSGKSTLLRRIAINSVIQQKPYVVWWVENLDFFLKYDAYSIEAASRQKHLVIIEDWYRNAKKWNTGQSNAFFVWLKNHSNVLVLIGDRRVNSSSYGEYIYGLDSGVYPLTGEENIDVLTHIANTSLHLSPIVAELQSQRKLIDENALFIILYVMAHIFEEKASLSQFELGDMIGRFRELIRKKLEALEAHEHYKGLGKAIYLCAKIYTDDTLSYFTFSEKALLIVAEYFGENRRIVDRMSKGGGYSIEAKSIFSVEQMASKTAQGVYSYIKFNHDTIPERGIVKAENLEFDDYDLGQIQEQLIAINEQTTALMILLYVNRDKLNTDTSVDVFLDFFEQHPLSIRGRLYSVIFNKFNSENKRKFAFKILESKHLIHLSQDIVAHAFKILSRDKVGEETALQILDREDFIKLNPIILSHAFLIVGTEGRSAAIKILKYEHADFIRLPFAIVSHAFKILGKEEIAINKASEILGSVDILDVQYQIVCNAFEIIGNKEEARKAAGRILDLEHHDFILKPVEIVSHALRILGNESVGEKSAKHILGQKDFTSLPAAFVSHAFKILKNMQVGKDAALNVLEHTDFIKLPFEMINHAFRIAGQEEAGKKAAYTILRHEDFIKLPHQIASHALQILSNEREARDMALKILDRDDFASTPYHNQVTISALNVLTFSTEGRIAARKIIGSKEQAWSFLLSTAIKVLSLSDEGDDKPLLQETYNWLGTASKKSKELLRLYFDIFYIPLFFIPKHYRRTYWFIKNHSSLEDKNLGNLYKILACFQEHYWHISDFKKEIKELCIQLLQDWQGIIEKQKTISSTAVQTGHIQIAMGHPELKPLAKEQAAAILGFANQEENQYLQRTQLYDVAKEIQEHEIYREWGKVQAVEGVYIEPE